MDLVDLGLVSIFALYVDSADFQIPIPALIYVSTICISQKHALLEQSTTVMNTSAW